MIILSIFSLCSFFMVFYAYFGYPLLLAAINLARTGSLRQIIVPAVPAELPSMSLIVTVRNEEKVIRRKLEETLLLHYPAALQIIVASDASSDATDSIVQEFAPRGVQLVRLDARGGKERAQLEALKQAQGEIIVFTDAKISLNEDALPRFAAYFSDNSVGAVSSIDRVQSDEGYGSGEGFYVRYEMLLRSMESHFLSLVGLSGSCFAARREICGALSTNVPSDFALLMEARRRNLRGVHAPDVIGTYKAVKTEEEEFARKVRTILRGMSTLFSRPEMMNPRRYGAFAWQMISHKLCRWCVPWFFLCGFITAAALCAYSTIFTILAAACLAFAGAAALAYFKQPLRKKILFKIPLFFIVSNAAVAAAWLKYLSGVRTVAWDPSAKAV